MNLERAGWFFALSGLFARIFYSASTATPNQRNLALFAMLGGVALIAFAAALSRKTLPWLRSPMTWSALTLLCVVSMTGPFEAESALGLMERLAFLILALALPSALADSHRRSALLASCLGAVFLLALLGLCQRLYLFDMLRGDLPRVRDPDLRGFFESKRARATFGQANAFAAALAMTLPFVVIWWFGEVSKRGRIAAGVAATLLVTAFVASGSRGGAWAAVCGLAMLFCDRRVRERHPKMKGFGLLLAAAALAGWTLWALVMMDVVSFDPKGWFQTLVLRRDYAATAARAFHRHAGTGVGFGFLGETMADYRQPGEGFSRLAHNGYLSTIAECGLIVGSLAIALFVRSVMRRRDECTAALSAGKAWGLKAPLVGGLLLAAWGGDLLFVIGADGDPVKVLNGILAIGAAGMLVIFLGVPAAKCLGAEPWRMRAAARAGGVAFLAHALVDTGFYVPNLLALLLGLSIASFRGREPRSGTPTEGLVVGLCLVGLLGAWLVASTPFARAAPLIQRERASRGTPLPSELRAEVTASARRAAETQPFHLKSLVRAMDALALSRNLDAIREAHRLAMGRKDLLLRLPAYRGRVKALLRFWRQIDGGGLPAKAADFEAFERDYRGI